MTNWGLSHEEDLMKRTNKERVINEAQQKRVIIVENKRSW